MEKLSAVAVNVGVISLIVSPTTKTCGVGYVNGILLPVNEKLLKLTLFPLSTVILLPVNRILIFKFGLSFTASIEDKSTSNN